MFKINTPRRPGPRRFLSSLALAWAAMAASQVEAATALVRWLPRGGPATGYAVYIRNPASTYGATPHWSGNPPAAADGSIAAQVTYTPSASGTNYFTVVALGANGEGPIANELRLGSFNVCRNDTCITKTNCDFSVRPDGAPCDDAFFCNGPEVCISGSCDTSQSRNCADAVACTVDACDEAADRCTHTGPPGCCLACDTADPCLIDACAQGDCSAPSGTEIVVNRVRFMQKAAGIKLAAKGTFQADPSVNPALSGVTIEFRAPDGTILYSSWVPPDWVREGATGGRYRFAVSRAQSESIGNGIERLDFRVKGTRWLVTLKAETEFLVDAFLEPTLTWVIRVGDSCARRMEMPCSQSPSKSFCR